MLNLRQCFKNTRYMQYAAALTATLAITSASVYSSWPSPALLKLNSTDSPLDQPITNEEGSWIVSIYSIAMIPAGIVIFFVVEKVSRKYLLLSAAVLCFFPWFLCIFANSVLMIYIARLISGIGGCIVHIIVPIYVGEIAEKDIRGRLGGLYNVLKLSGTLVVFSTGPFVSYTVLAVICSLFPLVFFLLFCFMPESPYYLVKNGKLENAKKSLAILSCNDISLKQNIEIVVNTVNSDMKQEESFFKLLSKPNYRKSLLIVLAIRTFHQLSGVNAVNGYAQTIINLSGSSISSEISSVIFGVVQLPTALLSAFLLDKVGRKPLWVISSVGCSFALIIEGVYFYLQDVVHKNLDSVAWLPTLALVLYLTLNPLGLLALSYVIIGEMFATNFKDKAAVICVVYGAILSFIVTKFFKPLSDLWGMHVMFWVFGVITFFGAIIICIIMPETKQKAFIDIQKELNKNSKSP